jgi:hypothetical protein
MEPDLEHAADALRAYAELYPLLREEANDMPHLVLYQDGSGHVYAGTDFETGRAYEPVEFNTLKQCAINCHLLFCFKQAIARYPREYPDADGTHWLLREHEDDPDLLVLRHADRNHILWSITPEGWPYVIKKTDLPQQEAQ